MPDDLPVIVIGENSEFLIAIKGVLAGGGTPLAIIVGESYITPYSLIRGSWIEEILPVRFICPDGEDTTQAPQDMIRQFARDQSVILSTTDTYDSAVIMAMAMVQNGLASGVVFAGPLPTLCLEDHEFAGIPFWESVVQTIPVEEALLTENDDFGSYPWSQCLTYSNVMIKTYPNPKPPIRDLQQRVLPVETNCDCFESLKQHKFMRTGPSAYWSGQRHRNEMFSETREWVRDLLTSPRLI